MSAAFLLELVAAAAIMFTSANVEIIVCCIGLEVHISWYSIPSRLSFMDFPSPSNILKQVYSLMQLVSTADHSW